MMGILIKNVVRHKKTKLVIKKKAIIKMKLVIKKEVRHSGAYQNPWEYGTQRHQTTLSRFYYLCDINDATSHDFSLGGTWIPASAGMTGRCLVLYARHGPLCVLL
jgi:hypothetical protein